MACNNTLTQYDIDRVKASALPVGHLSVLTVPEDLWNAQKAITSRDRGVGKVTLSSKEGRQFAAEAAPRDLQTNLSWLGNQRATTDETGHVTWIGNERVHYDSYGGATWVGDRRIYRRIDGSISHVGYDQATSDIFGNLTSIGHARAEHR